MNINLNQTRTSQTGSAIRSQNQPSPAKPEATPTESFVSGSENPMADIAKLRDTATGRNPYGDNAGVGSSVERGSDLNPVELPLMCCYALE